MFIFLVNKNNKLTYVTRLDNLMVFALSLLYNITEIKGLENLSNLKHFSTTNTELFSSHSLKILESMKKRGVDIWHFDLKDLKEDIL